MTATTSERGVLSRLYNGETDIQFIPRWRRWFVLSAAIILLGLVGLVLNGLNLGIDFEGGISWEVPAGKASVADVRDAVEGIGVVSPGVVSLGSSSGEVLRVQAKEVSAVDRKAVERALAEETGSARSTISRSEVGPSWGSEISGKALRALIVFLVLVSLYIAFRFEWKMAVATLVALVHDILVTVGIYALLGLPVTPATVIAFLTILGYSIYDGIVVFDRVDENAKKLVSTGASSYSEMVNRSMNQVLMRTLNTSITALLPILSLLVIGSFVLGATSLEEFATALLIGLLSGAYSSIFIASPLLALLKEREPRWAALRRRHETRAGAPLVPSGARPASALLDLDDGDEIDDALAGRPFAPPAPGGVVQPRPRKKGRRR